MDVQSSFILPKNYFTLITLFDIMIHDVADTRLQIQVENQSAPPYDKQPGSSGKGSRSKDVLHEKAAA